MITFGKKKKYIFLAVCTLLITAFVFYFLGFFAKEKYPLADKLTIAVSCYESSLLVYSAQSKGLFQEHGIEVEVLKCKAESILASCLIKGDYDLAVASDAVLAREGFRRANLRVISVISETRAAEVALQRGSYSLLVARGDWVNQNPELAQRIIRVLIEAERSLVVDRAVFAKQFRESFEVTDQCLERIFQNYRYYVHLPQSLLLSLEAQAARKIEDGLVDQKTIPNYLNFIYPYAIEAIDSLRVTMIR